MFRETQEAGTSSTENHGDAEGDAAQDRKSLAITITNLNSVDLILKQKPESKSCTFLSYNKIYSVIMN